MVKETRFYSSISDLIGISDELDYGIIKAKKALNDLHHELGAAGYSQVNYGPSLRRRIFYCP